MVLTMRGEIARKRTPVKAPSGLARGRNDWFVSRQTVAARTGRLGSPGLRATVLAEQGLDTAVMLQGLKADLACRNIEVATSIPSLLARSYFKRPGPGKCGIKKPGWLATVKPTGSAVWTWKKCRAFPIYLGTG